MKLQDLVQEDACDEGKTAVVFDDGEQQQTACYVDVERMKLAVKDVLELYKKETVGLYMQEGTQTPGFILGVLEADCAFYSIGNDVPAAVLASILEQQSIRLVLSNCKLKIKDLNSRLSSLLGPCTLSTHGPVYCVALTTIPVQKLQLPLAYIITTSGTTGAPKVVRVPHSCIVPNILHLREIFQVTPSDVIFQASPLTFDPSIVEMFLALCAGATLLVTTHAVKVQPRALLEVLTHRNKATVIQATPTLISPIASDLLQNSSSVRVLAFGGEPCPSGATIQQWRQAGNRTRPFNLYGITEVSCWASCYAVMEEDISQGRPIPLGNPLSETQLVIKDENGKETTEGELYIGGEQRVCLINDEAVPVPGTLRRTGDRVRRDIQGQIWYEGRTDNQLKRMGKRVNLEQIEQVAAQCPTVSQAVVLHHEAAVICLLFTSDLSHTQPANSDPDCLVDQKISEAVNESQNQKVSKFLNESHNRKPSEPFIEPHNQTRKTSEYSHEVQRHKIAESMNESQNQKVSDSSKDSHNQEVSESSRKSHNQKAVEFGKGSLSQNISEFVKGSLNLKTSESVKEPYNQNQKDLESLRESRRQKTSEPLKQSHNRQLFETTRLDHDNRTTTEVRTYLQAHLPGYCLPDKIYHVEAMPMTVHGKVDRRALLEHLKEGLVEKCGDGRRDIATGKEEMERERIRLESKPVGKDVTTGERVEEEGGSVSWWARKGVKRKRDVRSVVISYCQDHLSGSVDPTLCFLDHGGTSFQAVALMETLLDEFCVTLPDLIDIILSMSINEVILYIESALSKKKNMLPFNTQGSSMEQSSLEQTDSDRKEDHQTEEKTFRAKFSPGLPKKPYSISRGTKYFPIVTRTSVNPQDHEKTLVFEEEADTDRPEGDEGAPENEPRNPDDLENDLRETDDLKSDLRETDDPENNPRETDDPESDFRDPDDLESDLRDPDDPESDLRETDDPENDLRETDDHESDLRDPDDLQSDLRDPDDPESDLRDPKGLEIDPENPRDPESLPRSSGDSVRDVRVTLQKVWEFETGKCVDASPLVIVRESDSYVYIGSHSHLFCCLSLSTGRCVWRIRLGDRVESSACSSKCGNYVIVGCYDGTIYVLCAMTGGAVFRYVTRGAVRCSPCTDPVSGLVLCGSHDRSMYALDVQKQRCVWETDLCSLSVVAGPSVCVSPHHVYAATLGGSLVALEALTGKEVWRSSLGRPLFSSPMLIEAGVCVGCVDGFLYAFSHSGSKMWQYKAGAEIFSSPSLSFTSISPPLRSTRRKLPAVVITSQDNVGNEHYLHCLSMSGRLLWKCAVPDRAYSTCFYFELDGKLSPDEKFGMVDVKKSCHRTVKTSEVKKIRISTEQEKDIKMTSDENVSLKTRTYNQNEHNAKGSCDSVLHLSTSEMPGNKCVPLTENKDSSEREEIVDTAETGTIRVESHRSETTTKTKEQDDTGQLTGSETTRGFVVACSIQGSLFVLDADTGSLCSQYVFPSGVFSSPVLCGERIVVGCRDNFVYCLSLDGQ